MKQNFLTLEELAKEVNRSISTLKHFERTKTNLAKKGIIINRYGTGSSAKYTVEYKQVEED